MSRQIIYSKDVNTDIAEMQSTAAGRATKPDNYASKLIKFIPQETIVAYTTLQKFFEAYDKKINIIILIVIIASFLVVNLGYLIRLQKVTNRFQLFISSLSFLAWIYVLEEPFRLYGLYNPLVSVLLFTAVTILTPFIDFKKK